MFFRTKKAGPRTYLQIVENHRIGGKIQQRVIATLGRLEELQSSGQLDALLCSGARFAEAVMLLGAHQNGQLPAVQTRRIGAALIFERLWRETGCQAAIAALLRERHYEFPMERAVFLTVLHRLVAPGSDRAAERWRRDYAIEGVEGLELHHLYRAMGWLGEPRPESEQGAAIPFAPRCTKDLVEEELFARRRDLFTTLELVFFDTTSYFEGAGGESLGQYGHSKDHRPDLKQMAVGVVIDGEG
ncbi:MAG: IS1634 family transposase, partial [Gammaproteobacteria bacterium]